MRLTPIPGGLTRGHGARRPDARGRGHPGALRRPVSMLSRVRVGYVVFEDDVQVVAEPFADAARRR